MKRNISLLICAAIACITLSSCNRVSLDKIREGDIVFTESMSNQAPFIKAGTMCRWSHCGVVVNTPNGLQVLEASKTVQLTPVKQFVGPKRSKKGRYVVKRPKQRLTKPIAYNKWLGQSYDMAFKFDNGQMYCSELVWLAYKEQGIELCKPRKVGDYFVVKLAHSKLGRKVHKAKLLRNLMNKRNITLAQKAVAPSDLYRAL